MLGNILCTAFEKSIQIYCTLTILIKKIKKNNINIASFFITLTEINNETHYVAKKKKKKTRQNCSDRIRTLSVNLQGSRNSDYKITAMVQ